MIRQHDLNKQNPFIRGYYMDPEICDKIVAESRANPKLFKSGIRAYDSAEITSLTKDTSDTYITKLFEIADEYKREFLFCYDELQRWGLFPEIKIQRYAPGKWYKEWHTENNGQQIYINRHLVYLTYLNDIAVNGETEFYHQRLKVKPEKGLTLIWPADWTHYHKGNVAEVEERFITSGWFCFDQNPPIDGKLSPKQISK